MADDVKSARRVFEFLEYFAKVRREVSVAEIARHYDYPNSSVSTVMRTMVRMGYLSYDPRARTYLPTARLPFLVDWVATRLYDKDGVGSIMQELSEATGETVLLGVQNGLRVQYVQVIDATGPVRLNAESGSFRGLANTAVGHILLSRFDDAHVGRLVRRINSEEADPARHVEAARLVRDVEAARRQGYALSIGGVVPGAGALAMLLPERYGPTPLAIAISSVEAVVLRQRDAYVALIRGAIARRGQDAPGRSEHP